MLEKMSERVITPTKSQHKNSGLKTKKWKQAHNNKIKEYKKKRYKFPRTSPMFLNL